MCFVARHIVELNLFWQQRCLINNYYFWPFMLGSKISNILQFDIFIFFGDSSLDIDNKGMCICPLILVLLWHLIIMAWYKSFLCFLSFLFSSVGFFSMIGIYSFFFFFLGGNCYRYILVTMFHWNWFM
jgi:hypothetical protein